jgi:hypothetical protein
MDRLKREDRSKNMEKKKKKTEQNQTKAEVADLEQKVGWRDLDGRKTGHTTRWIRWRMINQVETNRSTNKPDPEETRQRLVAVGIGSTAA